MFADPPEILIYVAAASFLLGWVVGKIAAYFGNKFKAGRRDPRDDRIRSLDAELRVAQSNALKATVRLEAEALALQEEKDLLGERDRIISEQAGTITKLKSDLRDSVMKTRELREELQERAAESIRSEVRLRDVETELSVARATTDLIATGVLEYAEEEEDSPSTAFK